jgi:hypothetical protein
MISVIPMKEFVVTVNVNVLLLLLLWYLQYPRFDRRYLHTWFNLVTDIAIQLVPVIFHPCDLVTCCNIA